MTDFLGRVKNALNCGKNEENNLYKLSAGEKYVFISKQFYECKIFIMICRRLLINIM